MTITTILKNNGFKSKGHFSEISGVNSNYQFRLWQRDEAAFIELVEAYAPFAKCKPMELDLKSIQVSHQDVDLDITAKRFDLPRVLANNGMSSEQICRALIDIANAESVADVAERQASKDIDSFDDARAMSNAK